MSMENAPLTIRDMIEPAIMAAGGWVNTHAHADRAYTLSPDVLELRRTAPHLHAAAEVGRSRPPQARIDRRNLLPSLLHVL